jgi:hypothetical protein
MSRPRTSEPVLFSVAIVLVLILGVAPARGASGLSPARWSFFQDSYCSEGAYMLIQNKIATKSRSYLSPSVRLILMNLIAAAGLGNIAIARAASNSKLSNIVLVIMDDIGIDQWKLFGYGGDTPAALPKYRNDRQWRCQVSQHVVDAGVFQWPRRALYRPLPVSQQHSHCAGQQRPRELHG